MYEIKGTMGAALPTPASGDLKLKLKFELPSKSFRFAGRPNICHIHHHYNLRNNIVTDTVIRLYFLGLLHATVTSADRLLALVTGFVMYIDICLIQSQCNICCIRAACNITATNAHTNISTRQLVL